MVSTIQEAKHVACSRCRDRKVKCDGVKPNCRRCLRNRVQCQYVRGRKQQSKSEWVRHLRTFSSQPGRNDVTRSLGPQSSQPTLVQTPDTRQPGSLDDTHSLSTRSPSPYLFEYTAVGVENGQGATPSRGSSYSSQTSGEDWSTPWCPTSSNDNGLTEPHPFLFESASTFCDTNFTSDLLTTSRTQALSPTYEQLMRPHTPVSLGSEATSSSNGFSGLSLPYDHTSYHMSSTTEAMAWSSMPVYGIRSTEHASPYS